MKIISVINQKGGCAKTTTVCNLAAGLAALDKKVLVIDLDPQANLTASLGLKGYDKTVYHCLKNNLPISEVTYLTDYANLDIVPADISLAEVDIQLASVFGRELVLRNSFEASKNMPYDYVLIDCNPSLGLLPFNAMVASDAIIIPVEPSLFSLLGIQQLRNVFDLVKKVFNPKLEILGTLLTIVDSRTSIANDVLEQLKKYFGDKVFKTLIHVNVAIKKAQAERKPINHYEPSAKGSVEYLELAKEVIARG